VPLERFGVLRAAAVVARLEVRFSTLGGMVGGRNVSAYPLHVPSSYNSRKVSLFVIQQNGIKK
jgi:hypothetical protein